MAVQQVFSFTGHQKYLPGGLHANEAFAWNSLVSVDHYQQKYTPFLSNVITMQRNRKQDYFDIKYPCPLISLPTYPDCH